LVRALALAGAYAEFQDAHGGAGLSETDLSVIYLAIREDAMVFSGDRLLRITAQARHLEIHGTLWIMDKLERERLLRPSVAADRLEALIRRTGSERRFFPKADCESLISRWSRR